MVALIGNQQMNIQQQQQQPSYLAGDSLIEMIINLRSENQNLVRALETNNEYVKERLNEFKRFNEEAKRREAQFAAEKADHEHQARKLQRQNMVLSERLKSMEAKLKEMKLEVSDSLAAAHSSKASSVRDEAPASRLYPELGEPGSFTNVPDSNTITMQMDATSGELLDSCHAQSPTAPPMDTDQANQNSAEETEQAINEAHSRNNYVSPRRVITKLSATRFCLSYDSVSTPC